MCDKNEKGRFVLNDSAMSGLDVVRGETKEMAGTTTGARRGGEVGATATCLMSWLCGVCQTRGGRVLLSEWLARPLLDPEAINFRLDLVEVFVNHGSLRSALQERLVGSGQAGGDLKVALGRVAAGTAHLNHLCRLYLSVETCLVITQGPLKALVSASDATPAGGTDNPNLCSDTSQSSVAQWLAPIQECNDKLKRFLVFMETLLDVDVLKSNGQLEDLRIRPGYSPHLEQLEEELALLATAMKKHRKEEESEYNLREGSLKLEKSQHLGYFFRVTLKDEKSIRRHTGVRILESLKSGVKFRTKELDRLNNLMAKIHQDKGEKVDAILNEVNKLIQSYGQDCFQRVETFMSTLDCIMSMASIAISAPVPFVRPQVSATCDRIQLDNVRHPLLERSDGMHYIANSVTLSKEKGLCILTGPNMGGKSTFLKSIGVTVLLAQVGCFVPCDFARLYPTDNILVRIGAGDSQSEGISTFMNEMLDMKQILDIASARSLILVDELGRGTSTQDGFGLAWAISEHIATKLKAPCVIATHFHELCSLADSHSSSFNMHCTALVQEQRFLLLYKIEKGKSSRSYGIDIAELAHFPVEVISKAKSYLCDFEGMGN